MKKSKSKSKRAGVATSRKSVTISNKATVLDEKDKKEVVDLDDEETGFGSWLKSGTGIEWMRLFVIGNSLIVFLTMTWPQMQKVFATFTEMIYAEDNSY